MTHNPRHPIRRPRKPGGPRPPHLAKAAPAPAPAPGPAPSPTPAAPFRPADALRTLRVTCGPGLAPYVARELGEFGLEIESEDRTGVETRGTTRDVMGLNLHLRTALHVLEPVTTFACASADELYAGVGRVPWERIIAPDGYLSVVSNVDTPSIDNTMFANLRVKDAIVDRVKARCGRRPDSGRERTALVVHLYWSGDRAIVSLDTSGGKLSDRGYRRRPHTAPMQETLAAAVLMAAGYDGAGPLVLPMCGSGALAIEAALIATGRPPGLLRTNFAFMHQVGFDAEEWADVRRRAHGSRRTRPATAPIVATDLDPAAIEAAQANAQTAGVEHLIRFDVCDIASTAVPPLDEQRGTVLMNPEYGRRLGADRDLEGLYVRIGDFLKQRCLGYSGFVFTGNPDLAKCIGLRTRRRLPFYNADIECRLLEYELYEGTRRERRPEDG